MCEVVWRWKNLEVIGGRELKQRERRAASRFLFQFRPHVMKKILLGVTGVRAEMRGGKAAQAWFAGAAAREIKPLQRAFNPDLHGKRGIKSVGEQQNAVGNRSEEHTSEL